MSNNTTTATPIEPKQIGSNVSKEPDHSPASSDTPETDAEERSEYDNQGRPYDEGIVDADFARKLERERNALREQIRNSPWCAACKETDCCVSGDGTCAMIRKYLSLENHP